MPKILDTDHVGQMLGKVKEYVDSKPIIPGPQGPKGDKGEDGRSPTIIHGGRPNTIFPTQE